MDANCNNIKVTSREGGTILLLGIHANSLPETDLSNGSKSIIELRVFTFKVSLHRVFIH